MKNKSALLEEVVRIQQLMGKKLLNEQWQKVGATIVNMKDKFPKLFSKFAYDIEQLSKAATDDEAIKILAKLANSDDEFAQKILPEIMKNLGKDVQKTINQITTLGEDQISKGLTKDQAMDVVRSAVDQHIKTPFQGLKDLIKKEIELDLAAFKPKPGPDKPEIQEIKDMLKNWANIKEIGPSLVWDNFLSFSNLPLKTLRANMNYLVMNTLNNIESYRTNSLKKIAGLLKQATRVAAGAGEDERIFEVINAEISALRKNELLQMDSLYDQLKRELKKYVDYELADKVVEGARKSQDIKGFWKHLMEEDYIGRMVNPKINRWEDTIRRFGYTLASGFPIKLSEYTEFYFRKYGVPKGAMWLYLRLQLSAKILYPVITTLLDLAMYPFNKEQVPQYEGLGLDIAKEIYFANVEEMCKSFDDDMEEEFKKYGVKEKEWNFWKTVIPFHPLIATVWDWFSRGLDYHVAGTGVKWMKDKIDQNSDKIKQMYPDSANNVISQIGDILVRYENNEANFKQFGIDSEYPMDDVDQFVYDSTTKTGTTYPDNRVFEWKEDTDPKYKGKGTFEEKAK